LVIEKQKTVLILLLLTCLCALAQPKPKPRIDFDGLISGLPDLPWDFEIRFVTKNGSDTDMLRIYYDGRVDLVRWRPDYPGSLASVCHSHIDDAAMKKLLELFRDKKFNDLPGDTQSVETVALSGEAIVSVRIGKLVVKKTDNHQRDIPGLLAIESALEDLKTVTLADSKSTCGMESVPAKP
jgi:hypothetical protein